MKKYERRISFKTLFLAFVRRYEFILMLLIPVIAATIIITQFVNPVTYYSTISLKRYGSLIKENEYDIVKKYATSESTATMTAGSLKEKSFYHSNGAEITKDEILKGISFDNYTGNSIYITFSFNSSDKSITQRVLNEIADITLYSIKSDPSTSSTYGGISIAEPASESKQSEKNKKNLLLGFAVGLAASLASAFIAEIVLDEVYDKDDVEILGAAAYEVSLPKVKKGA